MNEKETKEQLEIRRLKLEIDNLSAPIWKRTGFLASVLTGLAGIALGFFSGFFDVKLDRLDNRRELLTIETLRLEDRKKTLEKSTIGLQKKVEELENKLELESRSIITTSFDRFTTSKEVAIWVQNKGKGVAHVEPYIVYIDRDINKKYIIDSLADWWNAVRELGISKPWVRAYAITGGATIESGGELLLASIEPKEFTMARFHVFEKAFDRIGVVIYYTSSTGKRDVHVFGKIPPEFTKERLLETNLGKER